MKKGLIFGILAVATLFAASPVSAYYPNKGDLVKISGNPAVYFIDAGGYRHLFPTENTFFSWYDGSWRDQSVKTISAYEFNLIPSGRNITARPGYALLRFENSMVMYAVLPGSRLCHAPAHYGNYQYNRALVIPVGFQIDYANDENCNIAQSVNLPNGTLLRYVNSNDIWYIQNNQRRRVTANGMNANNFRYESVINDVDWSMSYPEGALLDGYDSGISDLSVHISGYGYNNNYNYNYCRENWSCGSWNSCVNGYQYRSCADLSNCGTTNSRPITGQSCSSYNYLCQENWTCGSWSSCAYGSQYRTCQDLNYCGTTNSKPVTSQTCSVCQENWTCGNWGACQTSGLSNGWQYRSCADANACGTYRSQPTASRVCAASCQTNWSCTGWTVCNNNAQTRSCIDLNNCNSASGKPITSQSCR